MFSAADCKVDVPEGKRRDWCISRFEVDEAEASWRSVRAVVTMGQERVIPVGRYTRLMYRGRLIMSDTPGEVCDHREAIWQARGRCLVTGLGLGMVIAAMLKKPDVEHVDVIEKAAPVIWLVRPHLFKKFGADRLTIHHADAFTWPIPRGSRWDVVWHDIWGNVSRDEVREMDALEKRFRRRCKWQGSWGRHFFE